LRPGASDATLAAIDDPASDITGRQAGDAGLGMTVIPESSVYSRVLTV
jgi:hypothetical protein